MKRFLQFAWLLLALGACLPGVHAQMQVLGDGGPGPVKAQHLTAELVSLAPAVSPGGTVQVGLVLTLEQHWHVYWINAGDSGEPPKIKWTLPAGWSAGPMQFPIPQRLPLGPLMDFGYEDTAVFPVKMTLAPGVKAGPVHLDAQVTWLVCERTCIPGKAHLGLQLQVQPNAPSPQPVGALAEALTRIPKPLGPDMSFAVTAGPKELLFKLKTGTPETDAEWYPFDSDQIQNAADQDAEATPDGVAIRVPRAAELTTLPKTMHGVIRISDDEGYEVTGPVTPGVVQAAKPSPQAQSGGVTALGAIGLAFVGGIILNLMPCVFPVLFLKGLALLRSSGQERRTMRLHGLVYTLGILVSFWVIVAALLGVRAGGSQAGWGFQLQSPVFLTVLSAGIFFFALSLAGMFDLGLSLTSVGGELAQKQGYTGSFFTGVLATVVATPCTAPLMGAAIGFALAQPAGITFAVFTALALGLAAPYLLLSFQPGWTKWLPKPGAWMEVFKQATAVIFFATVIWLVWVYGRLWGAQGVDHLARLLVCLLIVAVAGWVLGRWPLRWSSALAAVVLLAGGLAVPLVQPRAENLQWQPYTPAALQAARAAGQPVFVDFTAAWCLSCQVNERLVLHASDVESQLASHHVALFKADWTNYDPAITKELSDVGRSGVPTYVIYPKGKDSKPDVLPELLTKSVVLEALKQDTTN